MNGFEARKQAKMERIREAALQLAEERGGAFRIEDVAGLAGVSQVSIYNYFGSKQGLVLHCLEHRLERQVEAYARLLASAAPFPEKMRFFLQGESDVMRFAASLTGDAPTQDPADEVARFFRAFQTSRLAPMLFELLEEGRRTGNVAVRYSDRTLQLYFEMYQDFFLRRLRDGGEAEPEAFLALFFYGLMGERSQ
ncbi:MAG TPA: TetR/AcrR family transcriptional regulator [Paenibacillus sp.]|nr:TetR/AcrR family transcriptional regulator [Paenibacillus sp.]